MVELWALRDGLAIAKELGLNNLIVELDALSVVMLVDDYFQKPKRKKKPSNMGRKELKSG